MLLFEVDTHQSKIFFSQKTENFPRKVLVVRKIVVPLHPLSGRDLMRVLVVRKIVVPLHPLSGRDLMSMKERVL